MRMPLPGLVIAAGLIGAFAGPTAGSDDGGFPTNLALLDRLAQEAVGAVLDSLAFQRGDTVTVMTEGGNEGDGFIAEAFARELARRGVAAHLTVELGAAPPIRAPQAPQVPQSPPSLPTGGSLNPSESAPPGAGSAMGDTTGAPSDSLRNPVPPDSAGVSTPAAPVPSEEPAPEPAPSGPSRPAGGPNVVRRVYPDGLVLEFRLLEFGISYPGVKRRFRLFGAPTVTRLGGVYLQASRIVGPGGTVSSIASGQSHFEDRLSARARRLAEGANYPFTKPAMPPGNLGRVVEPVAVVGIVASLVYLFYQNQN